MTDFMVFNDHAFSVASVALVKRYDRKDGNMLFKVYLTGVVEPISLDLHGQDVEKMNRFFEEKGSIADWLAAE